MVQSEIHLKKIPTKFGTGWFVQIMSTSTTVKKKNNNKKKLKKRERKRKSKKNVLSPASPFDNNKNKIIMYIRSRTF